jgi:hypothetical protein
MSNFFPPYDPGLHQFDPAILQVDAKSLQFKGGADTQGVTGHLSSVRQWLNILSGTVVVWQRCDGQRYIADGHQRRRSAIDLKQDETGQPIRLNGFVLNEAKGWTAEKVRIFCALKNIAEGGESTDPVDVARLVRNGADLKQYACYITLQRKSFQHGLALAQLSEPAFDLFLAKVQGYAPLWGVAVGNGLPHNPELHVRALQIIQRYNPRTDRELNHLVDEVGRDASEIVYHQPGLFEGDDDASQRIYLVEGRVKVLEAVFQQLSTRQRALRGAKALPQVFAHLAGCVQNIDAVTAQLNEDEKTALVLRKLATTKGPVSDALDGCARQFIQASALSKKRRALATASDGFISFLQQQQDGLLGIGSQKSTKPSVFKSDLISVAQSLI